MISAIAPAKINLAFYSGPRRPDGYHEVVSVYQALDLFEKVSVETALEWIVEVTGATLAESARIPTDKTNLVVKAALALAEHAGILNPQPMRLVIEKRVPAAAGVAGGSADAAASLLALNRAWGLDLSRDELSVIASKVGADVPFSLLGGTALGVGIGTELFPLAPFPESYVLLIFSTPGLATADVFSEFDRLLPHGDMKDASQVTQQYETAPASIVGINSLERAAFSLRADLAGIASRVPGQRAYLSGSGPTLYLLSQDRLEIETWAREFSSLGQETLITKTSLAGAELKN
ncbi:MAG: 4-(cytidine 5'-diphospho)-2-C-methyl-D-erythritol kinase [Aquiluna sp.]|nr:4-(cytidine 5'-diphospho)-2-C-methyl-D-erythritol kinase [Aquiluna sp.]